MSPPTRSLRWLPTQRWKPLAAAAVLAVLLHALVMGAVPWGAGAGSEGGARPLQVRQIMVAAPAPPTTAEAPPVRAAAPPAPRPPAKTAAPAPPPSKIAAPTQPPAAPAPAPVEPTPIEAAAPPPLPAEAAASVPEAAQAAASAPEATMVAVAETIAAAPGATATDAAGGAPLPVYATRPAPTATLRYELRRGGLRGSGELVWRPRGDGYTLTMRGTAFALNIIEWTSEGAFDSAGVAPLRFVDRRRGRDARAANFQREAGRITYSGPSNSYPLVPGAQDRVSWMLQLPAIVDAAPAVFVPGERIGLFVTGARGDADVWTFTVEGSETLDLPGGKVEGALRLRREPRKPHDTRVEVWLDPARHHLPVRVRLSSAEAGEGNEFLLESMTLQP